MLKQISSLISPDLLHVLAMMGHGDELAIVDTNFPAHSVAQHTVYGQVLTIGSDLTQAVRAVLTLLPLDSFVPQAGLSMQVVDQPDAIPQTVAEITPLITAEGVGMGSLERFDFYARARDAFAILQTQETRIYGNVILKKGIIAG
ncbi:RbsD/FucU domain-containing protein [Paracoccus sp. (in: a-proteobacteria)]|uniref:RbsD/FucU family protein n=1 Tax=Paracoccus sp. TaxID=267 RepID=UPI0028A20463|nr:RbsD/FucU domain-containing protein [Paracoccus sp. (in: a-proteobacteria)]